MTAQSNHKSSTLLGANDLTLVAPIKPGLVPAPDARSYATRLRVLLRTLNGARIASKEASKAPALTDVVDAIRAIRAFRLAIVGPEQNQLVLAVAFDGPWESYMRQIWRDMGPLLDVIFCNCEGYLLSHDHSYADYVGWVRSAQVSTEYFYEASLLTVSDSHVLRERARVQIEGTQPASPPPTVDETISQALPALVALFGLADLYPPQPGNADGLVLWRAARLLLKDLADRGGPGMPPSARTATERAAWRWFFSDDIDSDKPPPTDNHLSDVLDQAQGGILAPYPQVTHGALVLVELADAAAAQALLTVMRTRVTTARAAASASPPPEAQAADAPTPSGPSTAAAGVRGVFHNLAFTFEGLRMCGLGDGQAQDMPLAFREGMAARSGMLGDWDHNHPSRWALPRHQQADRGGPRRVALSSVHAVVQVSVQGRPSNDWDDPGSSGAREWLRAEVSRLEQRVSDQTAPADRARRGSGLRVLAIEPMQRLASSADELPRGHFGFADGISQPWTQVGGPSTYSAPGDEVPLGDLLLGHPNGLHDAAQPGALWVNSSFLVVRKLRQHVAAWRKALAQVGADRPEAEKQLMGRTPDGVSPISGKVDNAFDYHTDAAGTTCPFQSHVRRANPRTPSRPDLQRVPRIMRRGMSYGPRLADDAAQDDGQDRGLMFMAYNASIPEQFEVIQSWLAGGNSASADGIWSGQRDPFVGVPQPGDPRTIPYRVGKEVRGFRLPDSPLVTLQWGLYLFVPSIDAMRELLSMARLAAEDEQLARARQATGVELANARTSSEVAQRGDDQRQRKWAREAALGSALIARLKAAEGQLGAAGAVQRWKAVLEDLAAAQAGTTQAVWTAIRQTHGGCLRTPYGVLVGSATLVDQVLQDAEQRYTVSGYAARMAKAFGRIYLGLDDGPEYLDESEPTNRFIQSMTLAEGFDVAWQHATDALARLIQMGRAGDTVSVQAKDLVDTVLARVSAAWFGLPDGTLIKEGGWHWQPNDEASCPGHFLAPSRYMFWPQPGPESELLGQRHGQVLKARALQFVKAQREAGKTGAPACGSLGNRMLAAIPDDERMARTLIGVMMGFLPTVDANLRLVLAEWLQDGRLASLQADYLAARAAPISATPLAAAQRCLSVELQRSMQRHPVPPLVWRTALQAHRLGDVQVNPGDRIVIGLGSATMERLDSDLNDPYTVFGGLRTPLDGADKSERQGGAAPSDPPAHGARVASDAGASWRNLGPTHACPGRSVATGVLLGAVAAVLERRDLRPAGSPTTLTFEAPSAAAAPPTGTPGPAAA